ncbi:hypothetical protein BP6252_04911 [Coleophoma cylindrospora]|uniref:Uncharacterized protein n=1 Tax=Coleophoma cylindrospora TaxID=1849047 RepID=A0A3D8S1T8_9HELO|nr:hypothetical protein BP6252_04911 [Coleophoma cylindrospora]
MDKPNTFAYKYPAASPGQGVAGSFDITKMEEQWQKIQEAGERRKVQNRIAQRKYRKNLKRRIEDFERQNLFQNYNAGSTSTSTTSTAPSLSLDSSNAKLSSASDISQASTNDDAIKSQAMVQRTRLISPHSESTTPNQEIGNPMNSTANNWICHSDQVPPSTAHSLFSQSPETTRNYMDRTSQDHTHEQAHFMGMSSLNDYIQANNTLIEDLENNMGSPESNSDDNLQLGCPGDCRPIQRHHSLPLGIESMTNSGSNPLHIAAVRGYTEIVELLVDRGIDINARDSQGWTALHLATERGQHKVVKILLEKGADIFNKLPQNFAMIIYNLIKKAKDKKRDKEAKANSAPVVASTSTPAPAVKGTSGTKSAKW